MKVFFKSIADLREYFGREPVELDLPEGATLFNLLNEIAVRWGPGLPKYLWDSEKNQFRGPIVLLTNKKVSLDYSTPLSDGQEIIVMKALAGGSGIIQKNTVIPVRFSKKIVQGKGRLM